MHPGIFDFSIHKVYPKTISLLNFVSSYLTFSPLPYKWRLFSVALSVSLQSKTLPVKKYGTLYCPDFPLSTKKAIRQFMYYVKKEQKANISKLIYPHLITPIMISLRILIMLS